MDNAKRPAGGWNVIRAQLTEWDKPALVGLIKDLYPEFADRIGQAEQKTSDIGWGFHDYIGQVAGDLWEELGDSKP